MSTTTTSPYGTVEYYLAALATELHDDRYPALVGRLRSCIEHDDLDGARNLLTAFDRLTDEDEF